MNLKIGTRIELQGTPALGVQPEAAVIGRWNEKISGPHSEMPNWHIVRFSDGARLCVHEDRFRVIDNR